MYEPAHFVENDLSAMADLILTNPLGLLISSDANDVQANSIPFLLNAEFGEKGVLRAHLARANPQIEHLKQGARALVVFQGPAAYVTPSWYQTKKDHGKVVPTWNYVMVQVRGKVRIMDDPEWLHGQLSALTAEHEHGRSAQWSINDAPADFIEMQKRAIVGIEIDIDEIAGKWKVSQNRPAADRVGVVTGFHEDGKNDMADLVRRYGKT